MAEIEAQAVVVGAGPIGIETAAGLRGLGVCVEHLEAGAIAQTMSWWAPRTTFFSSPERIEVCGVPLVVEGEGKATGERYRDYLRGVIAQFGLVVRTHERVVGARREGGGWVLRTGGACGGNVVRAPYVVLATGNMDRPRPLGVPGEDLPNVDHYFRGPNAYVGRRVLIVGGKNSAAEAAIRLYRAGVDVAISYRRAAFDGKRIKHWLLPELEWLIGREKIGFLPETEPVRFERGSAVLRHADGRERAHACDLVLALTGYEQDATLFGLFGVELDGSEERRPVFDKRTMRTGAEGVYVAGTACGGSQRRARYYIENAHVHAERIVGDIGHRLGLCARPASVAEPEFGEREES